MYTFMLSWSLNSTLQSRTGMNGTLLRATAANWAVLGMGAVPWIKGKIWMKGCVWILFQGCLLDSQVDVDQASPQQKA